MSKLILHHVMTNQMRETCKNLDVSWHSLYGEDDYRVEFLGLHGKLMELLQTHWGHDWQDLARLIETEDAGE